MTDPTPAPVPTTMELVGAFADALAPFAGPYGVPADLVMHAGMSFLSNLQAQKAAGVVAYTIEDLNAAADKTTGDLAQLAADIAAQKQA